LNTKIEKLRSVSNVQFTYRSPGCTASTKSLCATTVTVTGVCPAGISSKEKIRMYDQAILNRVIARNLLRGRPPAEKILGPSGIYCSREASGQ
jgi:hypothetical protein